MIVEALERRAQEMAELFEDQVAHGQFRIPRILGQCIGHELGQAAVPDLVLERLKHPLQPVEEFPARIGFVGKPRIGRYAASIGVLLSPPPFREKV